MRLPKILSSLLIAKTDPNRGYPCEPVSFHISASALNALFKTTIDPLNGAQVIKAVNSLFAGKTDYSVIGSQQATDDVDIKGIYCTPPVPRSFSKRKPETSLQVLVHGATFNGSYWTGLGYDKKYSWVDSAIAQGHSTLAIDLLGHGLSDHPNAVNIVQEAFHVEVLHQLFLKLRHKGSSYKHKKLIYVGHSYGSLLGNVLTARHPDDVDALVLTGWTSSLSTPLPQILNNWKTVQENPGPDSDNRKLPPSYLRPYNETARVESFFGLPDSYNPALAHYDFVHADVQSIGEILSQSGGIASDFEKPVLVAAGDHDKIFCPAPQGPCQSQLYRTKSLFPKTLIFDTYLASVSGHCLNLDYGATKTFAHAQQWITKHTST